MRPSRGCQYTLYKNVVYHVGGRNGSFTFLQITTKLQLIHILQITISITSNYCEFTNYNFTNTITFSHVCCLQIPVGLHLNIMLDIGYDIIELWYLIMVFAVCKSKRKDTSITALMHAGTGTIVHYHYWLSVTINCHYYSFHVSENNRQCMRFICLLYLMNTSNVVRTSPPWVWSGIDSIVFAVRSACGISEACDFTSTMPMGHRHTRALWFWNNPQVLGAWSEGSAWSGWQLWEGLSIKLNNFVFFGEGSWDSDDWLDDVK